MRSVFLIALMAFAACTSRADERLLVWPGLAPGETEHSTGRTLPFRPDETPRVTRVVEITQPTLSVHIADNPNGAAAVILPGGGFSKVVPDKEGSEAAEWLNRNGVSAFVLSYRTTDGSTTSAWVKPLQDAQRSVSLVRSQAARWRLSSDKIGIVAFSAGGQVGARLLCDQGQRTYESIDDIDRVTHRPDFAVLVYPWNLYDVSSDRLVDGMTVPADCPPTWIVHTHDDRSSSLGAVYFYAGLKKNGIASGLHVYGNGGHGYGMRDVAGSQISSWPGHAMHWLQKQGFASQ